MIVFEGFFLVSDIMCYEGCGLSLQNALSNLHEFKQQNLLPQDAQITIATEPHSLGLHWLMITIESENEQFNQNEADNQTLSAKFKNRIKETGFAVIDNHENVSVTKSNWLNIAVNLLAMLGTVVLLIIFSPSLLLTMSLTLLSFVTTAFTARSYFHNFFRNLRSKNLETMSTSITLGWLLSLAHTLYHSITMPLAANFSMIFMNFHMPIMLITVINIMDVVRDLVSRKMQKMGMKTLFPEMVKEYGYYQLSPQDQENLFRLIETFPVDDIQVTQYVKELTNDNFFKKKRYLLKKGMLITINQGESFPVDGVIIHGKTFIDASLMTGETRQSKQFLSVVPAGAINLGQKVTIFATKDNYHSTINQLLFGANRAPKKKNVLSDHKFFYLYTALILVSIVTSILVSYALGIFTLSLLLQNIIGILFTICPCTITIAHELPKSLSVYQRSNKGIIIRNGNSLVERLDEIQTIVFDKTGTLTTGNSEVDSFEGISSSLWQRIYLLETQYGAEHPLAKAISNYYKAGDGVIINDIKDVSFDGKNRGLSAIVQGKEIHLGNLDYLRQSGVVFPTAPSPSIENTGYTPVYVAEDKTYKGVILIKHEIRKDILAALKSLKKEGKKLIMLTGDNLSAAKEFNQQINGIFEEKNIHARQTPTDKENFLRELMDSAPNSRGIWFVGDGLNDALCARIISEKGGISCSMTKDDKLASFTDINLNGSLDYLFANNPLNLFLHKNIFQNQLLLAYSAITFLVFIVVFSIAGIAVPPLVPMAMMISTTLFCFFNSYRAKLSVDNVFDKKMTWLGQSLLSDLSIGLLVAASVLLISSVLISTVATGGLALPVFIFSGAAATVSSICVLMASVMIGALVLISTAHLFLDKGVTDNVDENNNNSTGWLTNDHESQMAHPSSPIKISRGRTNSDLSLFNQNDMVEVINSEDRNMSYRI